jgi:ribosome-associated protein
MSTDTEQFVETGPSKSQLKRDMTALQALGEQLITLTPALLEKCALPGTLLAAIEEYHRIPSSKHGALRRHIQYIGKVMRDVPPDTLDHIRQQLQQQDLQEKRHFHDLENLRANLLSGDNTVLARFVDDHPGADIQLIRSLIRNARKEADRNQPPESSRKLFKLLRSLTAD